MKNSILLHFIVFLLTNTNAIAQSPSDPWSQWGFLIGDWTGEGSGKPGEGEGSFSLIPDLDGKVLIRKNHSIYPATKDKPAIVHDDLMIVYLDYSGIANRAIYFDNEGHTIQYGVTFGDANHSITLTSEAMEKAPRFRLTYLRDGENKVKIKFEIAPPGKPDASACQLNPGNSTKVTLSCPTHPIPPRPRQGRLCGVPRV